MRYVNEIYILYMCVSREDGGACLEIMPVCVYVNGHALILEVSVYIRDLTSVSRRRCIEALPVNPQRWQPNPNIRLSITVSTNSGHDPGTGRGLVVPERI